MTNAEIRSMADEMRRLLADAKATKSRWLRWPLPDGMVHFPTEEDVRVTLCGQSVGDGTWRSTESEVDCPVCLAGWGGERMTLVSKYLEDRDDIHIATRSSLVAANALDVRAERERAERLQHALNEALHIAVALNDGSDPAVARVIDRLYAVLQDSENA